jgi:hypothetical protein
MNTILTNSGVVPEPTPAAQGVPQVAEQQEYTYPRYYFSKDEPAGRIFASQEELDAAGGKAVWLLTPTAVAEAAQTPAPTPEPTPEGESPTPRTTSRR